MATLAALLNGRGTTSRIRSGRPYPRDERPFSPRRRGSPSASVGSPGPNTSTATSIVIVAVNAVSRGTPELRRRCPTHSQDSLLLGLPERSANFSSGAPLDRASRAARQERPTTRRPRSPSWFADHGRRRSLASLRRRPSGAQTFRARRRLQPTASGRAGNFVIEADEYASAILRQDRQVSLKYPAGHRRHQQRRVRSRGHLRRFFEAGDARPSAIVNLVPRRGPAAHRRR